MSLSPLERENLYKEILFSLIRSDRGYTLDAPATARILLSAVEKQLATLTSSKKVV